EDVVRPYIEARISRVVEPREQLRARGIVALSQALLQRAPPFARVLAEPLPVPGQREELDVEITDLAEQMTEPPVLGGQRRSLVDCKARLEHPQRRPEPACRHAHLVELLGVE